MVACLPCFYCIFVLKWVSVYLYQVMFYSYLYIDMSSSNLCNLYLYLSLPWYNSNKFNLLSINMLQLLSWLTTKYIWMTRITTAEKTKKTGELLTVLLSKTSHLCHLSRWLSYMMWYIHLKYYGNIIFNDRYESKYCIYGHESGLELVLRSILLKKARYLSPWFRVTFLPSSLLSYNFSVTGSAS